MLEDTFRSVNEPMEGLASSQCYSVFTNYWVDLYFIWHQVDFNMQ